MFLWEIRNGSFSATLIPERVGDLAFPKIRKLVKLAAQGDEPEKFQEFVNRLPAIIDEQEEELLEMKIRGCLYVLEGHGYPIRKLSARDAHRLYNGLIHKQKRRIANLRKIKDMEEIKLYEQED